MYLRDTGMIQDKHRDIIRAALQEVLDLISGPTESTVNIPSLAGLSIVDIDDKMGNYADERD